MRYTEMLSAQCLVLSQRLGVLREVVCSRVRGASWNAPALWRFGASLGLRKLERIGALIRCGPPSDSLRLTVSAALRFQNAAAPDGWAPRMRSGTLSTQHSALSTLALVVCAFFITLVPAHSQGLKIQLVAEQTAIVPGKPFTVGLWLQHPEGAHTYWRCPGIVGVPTQMEWQLPPGWKASELIYPEPERTYMFQLRAQGYDRDVMLRSEITPPADLKSGESITLTGKASWMCCGNSCQPGAEDLSLTLPVAEKTSLNEKWHRLFEAERARAEQPSDAWAAAAEEKGEQLTLTLKPATPAARLSQDAGEAAHIIVFTEDGWFDSDKPQVITRHADGSLTIQLTKADAYLGDKPPATLRAILRNEAGWLQGGKLRCLQIAPRIERAKAGG